jgi:hypothetical protein
MGKGWRWWGGNLDGAREQSVAVHGSPTRSGSAPDALVPLRPHGVELLAEVAISG